MLCMARFIYRSINYLSTLVAKTILVTLMCAEISKEYLSTFNRQLQTQLHNELVNDYAFPHAVCKSLSELFMYLLQIE